MDKNILYYGVELDKESQDILKKRFGVHEGWRVFCHHMTVVFNSGPNVELSKSEKNWFEKNKNTKLTLIVTHFGINEKVAAVRVMCSTSTRSRYKHIVLGINLENKGKPGDAEKIEKWVITEPLVLFGKPKIWVKDIKKKSGG